ncbi:MAG: hypothetical protein KJZ86_22150 [Caldilineaceae bacterium]|nr:hypothetical protein [Caldilineaceae bacterium]
MIAVSVQDVKVAPDQVWAQLRENRDLLLISEGKPIALMISIEDQDPEEMLRSLRILRGQKAAERMRNGAVQRGLDRMTLTEVNEEIAVARRESGR